MNDRILVFLKNLLLAFAMAVLFVSWSFLNDMIFFKYSFFAAAVFSVVSAFIYGIYMVSSNKWLCLLRWGLSLPLSYAVINYFWETNFAARAIFYLDPEYGCHSASEASATGLMMIMLSILFLFGGLIGTAVDANIFVKVYGKRENFEKAQIIFCVMIVAKAFIFMKYKIIVS